TLLLVENGALTRQLQFVVANCIVRMAKPERDLELKAQLPFLEVSRQKVAPGAGKLPAVHGVVVREQVFAEPAPAVAANGIETGVEQVLCREQFEFAALDQPFLPAQLGPPREGLGENDLPLEQCLG